jgi:FdhD protein
MARRKVIRTPTGRARLNGSSTGPGACTPPPCSPRRATRSTYEDVGRHNAVGELAGRALQNGDLPISRATLPVSGGASFEPGQKAVTAGCPILAAVSAPLSPAVDLAAETGLTLVFPRGTSMDVYAGEDRLTLRAAATQG